MKTLQHIREEREKKISELLKKHRLFFDLRQKQFEENKTPLKEGEGYVPIYCGGFARHTEYKAFKEELTRIMKEEKEEIKKNKQEEN